MVQFVYCDGVLKDNKCRNMALALNFYGLESQISPILLKRFLPFKRHLMEVPKFFMPTVSHQKKYLVRWSGILMNQIFQNAFFKDLPFHSA